MPAEGSSTDAPGLRPELRVDVLTGQQVIVAPARSQRPSAFVPDPPLLQSDDDPFLQGHEHLTPDERWAVREDESTENGPGWLLRVVPNRYPAVLPEAAQSVSETRGPDGLPGIGLFSSRPAVGEHDVVIECPDHRTRLRELLPAEVERLFAAWRQRLRQLSQENGWRSVVVFRNEGFSAGASLSHCHSQIVALRELTPFDIARRQRRAEWKRQTGGDLMTLLVEAELTAGARIVSRSEGLLTWCPFAPRSAWHVRIMPEPVLPQSFANAGDVVLASLARQVLERLAAQEAAIGGPMSFNLLLVHPPLDTTPDAPWYLDIVPRTGRFAGFELLSGIDIVTVSPEHAATILRRQLKIA
jgi:UDPglucose--hexose-1-phosphate uridylyltransferase